MVNSGKQPSNGNLQDYTRATPRRNVKSQHFKQGNLNREVGGGWQRNVTIPAPRGWHFSNPFTRSWPNQVCGFSPSSSSACALTLWKVVFPPPSLVIVTLTPHTSVSFLLLLIFKKRLTFITFKKSLSWHRLSPRVKLWECLRFCHVTPIHSTGGVSFFKPDCTVLYRADKSS